VRRWLVVFIVIAIVSAIAGYVAFSGADMGR
jgi:uncharacterized membrane protein YtjA (UPF0391 family)